MGDSGLWIAALTGATAVLASWVTSRGHTQAARLQAKVAAAAQHDARRNEARRATYLAFIEHAHLMGVQYRRTPAVLAVNDASLRRVRLEEHMERLREVFGPFRHGCQMVAVDGHASTIDAANGVLGASGRVHRTLRDVAFGSQEPQAFCPVMTDYWAAIGEFVEAVRLGQE